MRHLLAASALLVGAVSIALPAGEVRERAPEGMLMMSGMPASPHPAAVLTPRPEEIQIAKKH